MTDRASFGLHWFGKEEASREAVAQSTCTWHDETGQPFIFDREAHHLIEGDNLDALKHLKPHLLGQVDLIYIDPPYNTGHDFVYSDRFSRDRRPGDDSKLGHAAWLSMIYPRLKLAKSLLSERGVIFVSIDDHELAHLTCVMNELWGEDHQLATLVISMNPKGRQLGRFATAHEYLLVYAQNQDRCALEYALKEAVNPLDFPYRDESGMFRKLPLRNSNKRFNPETRPNLYFPLYIHPETGEVSVELREGAHEVWPIFGSGEPAVWRWSRRRVQERSDELWGGIVRGRLGDRWDIQQKDYNHPDRKKKLKSIWLSDEIGSTDQAAKELKAYGVEVFETPKPLKLLRRILSLSPEDALVLDFFAGSGTTCDAVLRANAEDGGTRKIILVQQASSTGDSRFTGESRFATITEITRARIRAVQAELDIDEASVQFSRVIPEKHIEREDYK